MFAALFSLSFLFSTLSDLGINQYIIKKLASTPEKVDEVFSTALGLKLLLLVVFPALMCLVGFVLGYGWSELYYLWLLSFFQGGTQMVLFFRSNFQAHQKFFIDSFASIIDKTILIVFLIILLQFTLTVESFIYVRLLSVVVAIGLLYVWYSMEFGWDKPKIKVNAIIPILKQSIPFALITVLFSFNERVDQVLVERVLGDFASGLYAGAYRWLDVFMMYLWLILPMFFAKFARFKDDQLTLNKTFEQGHVLAFVPISMVAGFIFIYPEKLFILFKHSSVNDIATMTMLLKVLFIAALLHGVFALYSTLLTSVGYEKKTSIMIFVSVCMNVALNLIFMPYYGVVASAWATVFSALFLSLTYVYLILKHRVVEIPYGLVFKMILTFVLFMIIYYALFLFGVHWIITTVIALALYAIMILLFKIIKFKDNSLDA
jgi:O-antigen/teichoic acid export membrane protein